MKKEKQANRRFLTRIGTIAVCICLMLALAIAGSVTAYAEEGAERREGRTSEFELLTPDKLPSNGPVGKAAGETLAGEGAETDTYIPLVLIVIGFEGQPYSDTFDWSASLFGGEWSVRQYYKDMSCGKFTYVPAEETSAFEVDGNTNKADTANDGVIHVSLSRKKTQGWGLDSGNVFNAAEEETNAYYDAIVLASSYIDFGVYDSNGDGKIQTNELALGFVVSGLDAAQMSEASGSIEHYQLSWPSAYSLTKYKKDYPTRNIPDPPVVDGVAVDNYISIAEGYPKGGEVRQSDTGTLTHELGHYLGLPDLYSTDSVSGSWWRYEVGRMSLMDEGCYGKNLEGNPRPYSLDMWSRVHLGWVEPQVITFDETADTFAKVAGSLSDGTEGVLAVRINTYRKGEYFLVENRRFTGWDEGMSLEYPYAVNSEEDAADLGGGFVIWHVDENMYQKYKDQNTVNSYKHHQAVMPVYMELLDGEEVTIGDTVQNSKPFFAKTLWQASFLELPLYGSTKDDLPEDRLPSSSLLLKLETKKNLPVMEFHVHRFPSLRTAWIGTESVHLIGQCDVCGYTVSLDITEDITSEVTKRPTKTEPGTRTYTAHFRMDNMLDYEEEEIPIGTVLPDDPGDDPSAFNAWKEKADDLLARLDGLAEKVSGLTGKNRAEAVQDIRNQTKETLQSLRQVITTALELPEQNKADAAEYFVLAEEKANVILDRLAEILANDVRLSIAEDVKVSGKKSMTYTGKPVTQSFVLTRDGETLQKNVDYTVSYENNVEVGTVTVIFTGTGRYEGMLVKNFSIVKANNTLTAKSKAVTLSASKLKADAQILARSEVLTIGKAKGTVSYAIEKAAPSAYAKYFVIGKSSGRLKVKKGLKAGTYKLKIKVSAAGTAGYKKGTKSVVVAVTVR